VALVARPFSQSSAATYTLYTPEGRRTLPFRSQGGVDVVSLDQVAAVFKLTMTEDAVVGGLTVRGRGQTVLLIPGQSFASIGPGRVVSLPGPVQRDRGSWQVPVEFIRLVIGPALGQRVDVRRPTRTILFGDVRLPEINTQFERVGPNARLTIEIAPAAPHRTVREGNRLITRFDAVALELAPVTGLEQEFTSAVRADGTSLIVELGSAVASYRADDPDQNHLVFELTARGAAPTPPPPPARGQGPEPPVIDTAPAGVIRTVVLDPGHGGADAGVQGPGGTKEKDYALQLARRLKAVIESRIGLRVLLTRDADTDVPFDRRTSLANNNKADLFISLHVNASVRPESHGAQVLSLSTTDYKGQSDATESREVPVPVVGGGSRIVDVVPWDFAQIPHAEKSAVVAAILSKRLGERGVPLNEKPIIRLPLRTLVGANMPAVMIEMGFLTTAKDEKALTGPELSGGIIDAILNTIEDVRRGIPTRAPEIRQ